MLSPISVNDSVQWVVSISGENFTCGYTHCLVGSVTCNNKKQSPTQLDSRKQVIAFQDRVMTINIKEAQHPLKREKQ